MILLLCSLYLCAIANRIRGGMFGDSIRSVIPFWGTTVARISMSGAMLIPLWFKLPWHKCLIAWVLLYVGFIFGWKAWQNMDNPTKDIPSLALRGLVLTAPIGLFMGSIPLALCGASMGILYYLGKFFPQTRELDGSPTSNVTWGEYFFGGVFGYVLQYAMNTL